LSPLPHLSVFEKLVGTIRRSDVQEQLKALTTFGLYVESECKYFEDHPDRRTARGGEDYARAALSPPQLARLENEARGLIEDFAATIIEGVERKNEIVQKAHVTKLVHSAVEAVHSAPRSRLAGVTEAVAGAFMYSVIIILISIIAHRAGIDILETYERAYGPGPK